MAIMIYVLPICECLTNRFDRRLNIGFYSFLCCDWFWCQCIDSQCVYLSYTGPQLVDSVTRKAHRVIFVWFINPDVNGLEIIVRNLSTSNRSHFQTECDLWVDRCILLWLGEMLLLSPTKHTNFKYVASRCVCSWVLLIFLMIHVLFFSEIVPLVLPWIL